MKTIIKITAIAFIGLFTACAGKNDKSEKLKADYQLSLNDSIESYKIEIDSCENQIAELREQLGEWMNDFTTVADPREAGTYTIMKADQNLYPLKKTGIIARINDTGQYELIAALSAKPFDCISVVSGEDVATSSVVPRDQALNYQTSELTTVSFTGAKTDSIGMLIANNELNPVSVTYLNNGKPVQSVKLSNTESKNISYTYLLYKTEQQLHRLEQRVPMLNERINLIRLHQDKNTK